MNKNVLICIPSFDQKIHLQTISSIISVRDTLNQAKIGCGMMWLRDSLITRARNKLVAEFLKQKEYTHLFFIDADIIFEPQQFIRVLLYDQPLTCASYPIKHEATIEKGDASFGWCIERKVFTDIIKKYPDIEYKTDVRANIDNKRETIEVLGNKEYAFFDCGIQGKGVLEDKENTQRYLSEDYFFCALWKQCGGEIWCDLTSTLKHIGIKEYTRKPLMKIKDDS
jgi:hypothetical protein